MQSGKEAHSWEPCPVRARTPTEMPVTLPPAAADGDGAEAGPPPTDVKELYCNESLYIFWRLYHYLYDRLRTARDCILEKAAARRTPEVRRASHFSAGDAALLARRRRAP